MKSKILYEQARPVEGQELQVRNIDWFVFTMQRGFGTFPVELDATHLKTLEGMAAATQAPNPYDVIIKAVKRYGSIRIWQQFVDDDSGFVRPTIDLPAKK